MAVTVLRRACSV
ncbi:hypothetical protein ACHAXR_003184 [Thalassiosira sp. AJA248-18]|eukprot:CCRYP_003326-RD/>CCRYP_003326-RD protein AED:0.49 eAED:0.49 QI:0/-1/0/1/-1/0/1/0/12